MRFNTIVTYPWIINNPDSRTNWFLLDFFSKDMEPLVLDIGGKQKLNKICYLIVVMHRVVSAQITLVQQFCFWSICPVIVWFHFTIRTNCFSGSNMRWTLLNLILKRFISNGLKWTEFSDGVKFSDGINLDKFQGLNWRLCIVKITICQYHMHVWTVLPKLTQTGGRVVPIDVELLTGDVFRNVVNISIDYMEISVNFYHILWTVWYLTAGHCS